MVDLPELSAEERTANRELWLTALESGTYSQTTGVLRGEHGFCCLGVAEDVRGADWSAVDSIADRRIDFVDAAGRPLEHDDLDTGPIKVVIGGVDDTSTILTADGARWLGVRDTDPSVVVWDDDDLDWTTDTLSGLNDSRQFTFTEIAAVVRDQPSDWNGRYARAQREANRRNAESVVPPSYARGDR
jgi:hypothetical protein